jgi:TetR/AcrR family transcriptional regulator, regulator of cefoperazone and chloramphenicol sensitivity
MFDESNEAGRISGTKRRIIEAAGEIFAHSGYEYTTIRAISERASVNVAAINYHFGGKKNLYLTVIKFFRAHTFEKYPFDPADFASRSPEDRLRAFIRQLLFRILDEGDGSLFARVMIHELIQPATGLDMVVEETATQFFAFLSETVARFFPAPPPAMTVNLCCLSVVGQIFQLYVGRHVMHRLLRRDSFTRQEMEMAADHITRFSLYAIRGIAANSEGEGA